MTEEKKKRRPKSGSALGNIDETKRVVQGMLDTQSQASREKTQRLKALRLGREGEADESVG